MMAIIIISEAKLSTGSMDSLPSHLFKKNLFKNPPLSLASQISPSLMENFC